MPEDVVVLVDDPGSLYLPEDDLNFLLGIMNACKLSMADIALINLNKNKTDYTAITDQFGAETVLLFGTDPKQSVCRPVSALSTPAVQQPGISFRGFTIRTSTRQNSETQSLEQPEKVFALN